MSQLGDPIFQLEKSHKCIQVRSVLSTDGSENRKPPEDGAKDECGKVAGFLPSHVACRIFGPDSPGISNLQGERSEILKAQRQIVAESCFLPSISHPSRYDAKGTEHMVRFRGNIVEKHQHSDGWVPFLDTSGLFNIQPALPTEYLRRLEFQNELFGDRIEIVGLTKANRFVTTQPTLRGGEPSENEMRDVLLEGMWQRVPIHMQNLPSQLMGTAWWHEEEGLILIDARKPNFKKTEFGILPIDLILCELNAEMLKRLKDAS